MIRPTATSGNINLRMGASRFPRSNEPASQRLQRALGLDRNLRVLGRQGTSRDAELLVAVLAAGHGDVVWIDVLAEPRHLVGPQRVGSRDDADPVFPRNGDLRVRDGAALRVTNEAEIGGPFLLAVVVVVTEALAAGPGAGADEQGRRERPRGDSPSPTQRCHGALLVRSPVFAV